MGGMMYEENDWDHNLKWDAVGLLGCVCSDDLVQILNELKTEKTHGSSNVLMELIAANGEVGIQVMAVICQRVLDWFEIPVEWSLYSGYNFLGQDDIRNCCCHGVKAV